MKVAGSGIEQLRARWDAASKTDGVVDVAEMTDSLQNAGPVKLEAITELMFELISKGTQFTGRARTLAFAHGGERLEAENRALKSLDDVITGDWLSGTGPIDFGQAGALRTWVKRAIAASEHPKDVSAYIGRRLTDARERLAQRAGSGAAIADQIQLVLKELNLMPSPTAAVPLHPSQFLAAGREEFAAQREAYYPDPAHVATDMVGLLNELIADGTLHQRDALFMQTYLEKWHPEPGPLAGLFGGKKTKIPALELKLLEQAIGSLPQGLIEPGRDGAPDARQVILQWIDGQREEGRARTDVHGGRQSNIALPHKTSAGQKVVIAPEGKYDYADRAAAAHAQIATIQRTPNVGADKKIEDLYRLAVNAQASLLEAARGVEVEGRFLAPTESDITRTISSSEIFGSSQSWSRSVGEAFFGLLASRAAASGSSSSVRGSSRTIEVTGKRIDLNPALEALKDNPLLQREAAIKYREAIAPHLGAMQGALTAIVKELGTAELQLSPAVLELLEWATTTRYEVTLPGEEEYFGPKVGTKTVPVKVVDRWVVPNLLGANT